MKKPLELLILALLVGSWAFAQNLEGRSNQTAQVKVQTVPPFIKFNASLFQVDGKSFTRTVGVTFALYREENGGVPLWLETQNVVPDKLGRFTVLLGSTRPEGLPFDIFSSGEALWLGITADDGVERPRVLLASVPYSLKAADADTLNGKTAADFVSVRDLASAVPAWPIRCPYLRPCQGTANSQAPAFEATSPVGPSFISDASSGPPLSVNSRDLISNLNAEFVGGVAATSLAQTNAANIFSQSQQFGNGISVLPSGTDAKNGKAQPSGPIDFQTIPANGNGSQSQIFRFLAETKEGSTSPSLDLLFGLGGATPSQTGLGFNPDGTITFASGQTFPPAAIQGLLGGSLGTTSTDPITQPTVYASLYAWQQQAVGSSNASGLQVGPNTVTLTPCPHGVNGTDSWHYVYVSGTGTPEVVLITGGTCVSGGSSGTIEFQAVNAHSPGYSIGTATGGLQEAIIDAVVKSQGTSLARPIVVNPTNYLLRARVSVRANNLSISGFGSILTCAMADTCLMLGDPVAGTFTRITVQGFTFQPGLINGSYPAIEDNANGSRMNNITVIPGTTGKEKLGYLIQVDNDQASNMTQIDPNGQASAMRCDVAFCGAIIYAPGPFSTRSAVGWISDSSLSMQCGTNGVDWESGNSVSISDSVIQGYPQYGVRAGISQGGYGGVKLSNVYEEGGVCPNPLGNVGQAGLIVNGGAAYWSGGEGPSGILPRFANTGQNQWAYYIVPNSATYGSGNPLLAGTAYTDNVTPITITTPDIAGAASFDVLKVAYPSVEGELLHAPNGIMTAPNEGAVAVGVLRSVACSSGLCTFVDATGLNPAPYTVKGGGYFPKLDYWPGSIVLGAIRDGNSNLSTGTLNIDQNFGIGGALVVNSTAGSSGPSIYATQCPTVYGSPVWISCTSDALPPATVYQQESLLLPNEPYRGGQVPASTDLKGRVNFLNSSGRGHVITLVDSNPDKTIATERNRPHNDPGDSYIGLDQGLGDYAGISMGAGASISQYIGNIGDGVNWLERLTASSKTFKVPVTINGNLTVTGHCTGCAGGSGALSSQVGQTTLASLQPGTSVLGFDRDGHLSVSENGAAPVELKKKFAQQFTYTFFDANNPFTTTLQVASIYVNRATPFRIAEIYCEVDSGSALINLQSGGSNILASGLSCSPAGTTSSNFVGGRMPSVPVGAKLNHVTVSIGPSVHRMSVVVKYYEE